MGLFDNLIKKIDENTSRIVESNERLIEQVKTYSQETLEKNEEMIEAIKINTRSLDIIWRAESIPMWEDINATIKDKQLNMVETLQYITENKISLARYGDGEFKLMLNERFHLNFQNNSIELREDLMRVMEDKLDNLLVGFPQVFHTKHWANVYASLWADLKPLCVLQDRYGQAHISRPLFFQIYGDYGVDLWRNLWKDKKIKVITGKGSRFDLVDRLFETASDITFEYSTPTNAYSDIDRLVSVLEKETDIDLFLVSLGPAGTILTYRLAKLGKWAIDVGHISSSYEHVMEDGLWPEATALSNKVSEKAKKIINKLGETNE